MTVDPWAAPEVPAAHRPPPPPSEAGGWTVGSKHRVLDMLEAAFADDPRSNQRHLGPSEVGSPCRRKLALRALDAPKRHVGVQWEALRGTAVHEWLSHQVTRYALKGELLAELGLHVDGDRDDSVDKLAGNTDLLALWDLPGGDVEVIDWKFVGKTTLDKVCMGRIGEGYHVQLQVYGLGVERTLGITPRAVSIVYLPAAGRWSDKRVVTRPYNRAFAQSAIDRWHTIRTRAREAGLSVVVQKAPTADDFCQSCPYLGVEVDGLTLCRGNSIESKGLVTA